MKRMWNRLKSGREPEGTLTSVETEEEILDGDTNDDEEEDTVVEPSDDVFPAGWGEGLRVVVLFDLVAVLAGLAFIYWEPWELDPGFSFTAALVVVVFATFGGVFARTGTMRTALGATLFLTYMVLAIFVLNITALAEHLEDYEPSESVFQTLTAAFTTVLVFYFGSEAYITATSIKEKGKTKRSKGGKPTPPGRRTSKQQG